jgi:hypothetical protein
VSPAIARLQERQLDTRPLLVQVSGSTVGAESIRPTDTPHREQVHLTALVQTTASRVI